MSESEKAGKWCSYCETQGGHTPGCIKGPVLSKETRLRAASEAASEEAQQALRDAATKCRAADTALAATGLRGLAAIHLAYLDGATACARAERNVLARLAEWPR